MKNLFVGFVLLFLVNCSTEEGTRTYTTAIRNTSDKPVHILILGDDKGRNTPVYDTLVNTVLQKNETFNKTYKHLAYNGLNAIIYYTKITFLDTSKGYICEKNNTTNNLCFVNKVSLTDAYFEYDFTLENGVHYYDITQTDYENAHVLP